MRRRRLVRPGAGEFSCWSLMYALNLIIHLLFALSYGLSIVCGMRWTKRFYEWKAIYDHEAKATPAWRLWIKIGLALSSGIVPKRVYIRRLRTCYRCPVYDPIRKACRPRSEAFRHLGCGCYVPFTAMSAAPYEAGCWGRQVNPQIGWPRYDGAANRSIISRLCRRPLLALARLLT
jgi:hypothetical protein